MERRIATEIFSTQLAGKARIVMSALNWAEITASLLRRYDLDTAAVTQSGLRSGQFEVISVGAERAVKSADIKYKYKIPYADAFGVELAGTSPGHIQSLLTSI